jgi:hypothetical protein
MITCCDAAVIVADDTCCAACRKMVEETEGSWGLVLIYLLTAAGEGNGYLLNKLCCLNPLCCCALLHGGEV